LKPSRDPSPEKWQASRLLGTAEKAETLFLTEETGKIHDYLYLANSGGTITNIGEYGITSSNHISR